MSVVSPLTEELFRVSVFKSLLSNPDRVWCNTYEIQNVGAATIYELIVAAGKIAEFERNLSLENVFFLRYTISTWEKDSTPYNSDNLVSKEIGLPGSREIGANEVLPLTDALVVNRNALSGKTGHIALRGILEEGDVESPAGYLTLSRPAEWSLQLVNAVTSSLVADLLGETAPIRLVMISRTGEEVRTVLSLSLGKPASHKLSRVRKKKA